MRNIYAKLAIFSAKLRALFPSRIPTAPAAFEHWVVSTLDLFEITDTPIHRNAIYTLIMHMGNTQTHHTKYHFAKALRRAQLQETTYAAIETLRARDKQEKAAAALTQLGEPAFENQKAQG